MKTSIRTYRIFIGTDLSADYTDFYSLLIRNRIYVYIYIYSNWYHLFYIGLNGIQFLSYNGHHILPIHQNQLYTYSTKMNHYNNLYINEPLYDHYMYSELQLYRIESIKY